MFLINRSIRKDKSLCIVRHKLLNLNKLSLKTEISLLNATEDTTSASSLVATDVLMGTAGSLLVSW